MKKINRYFKSATFLMLFYLLILYLGYAYASWQNDSLSDWVIGKWYGEREYTDNAGVHSEEIYLEFLRPGILIYSSSLSRELEFGIVFRYTFTSNKQLSLSGRLSNYLKRYSGLIYGTRA